MREYLETGDPESREFVRRSRDQFREASAEYQRLASEDRAPGREAERLYEQYLSVGQSLMDNRDRRQDLSRINSTVESLREELAKIRPKLEGLGVLTDLNGS